jgi:hypothetical protein
MAAYRGAKPEAEQINLYAARLSREIGHGSELQDMVAAIEKIADMPRESGELAFPEVGQILCLVPVMRMARLNRAAAARATVLVRWKCFECGVYRSAYIHPDDRAPRVCNGVPRGAPQLDAQGRPEPCGAIMDIVYDDRRAA